MWSDTTAVSKCDLFLMNPKWAEARWLGTADLRGKHEAIHSVWLKLSWTKTAISATQDLVIGWEDVTHNLRRNTSQTCLVGAKLGALKRIPPPNFANTDSYGERLEVSFTSSVFIQIMIMISGGHVMFIYVWCKWSKTKHTASARKRLWGKGVGGAMTLFASRHRWRASCWSFIQMRAALRNVVGRTDR